jgi:hypothetical protein
MNIEQRLAGTIRSFRLDLLADAVLLNVDLDVVLSVLDYATCVVLHRRLPGYATTMPGTVQRRFLFARDHTAHRDQIIVRASWRTCSLSSARPCFCRS